MTKQIINTNSPEDLINVGNSANDRRGDSLRAAFVKLNDAADKIDANFTELYAHTATDATDRLVNGTKELVLNVDGDRSWVDFPAAFGDSITVQGSEIGAITGTLIVSSSNNVVLNADALENPKSWTFGRDATLNTPLGLPASFTAVLDTAHMTPAVALTDTPWQFAVQFQVNPDGSVQTVMDSPFPNPVNPGYVSGYEFTFTEADHGIPDYIFTLVLTDVVLPGGAGWTANPAVSPPPEYPSTVKSTGAIKLTADTKSWTLGTDGSLTLPGNDVSILAPGQNLTINAANYVYIDSLGAGQIEIGTGTSGSIVVLGSSTGNIVARSGVIFENITDEIKFTSANRLGFGDNVNIAGGTSAIIFTAPSWITSVKLVIVVEGRVDGDLTGVDHTQTCEASIAATYNTSDEPVMSVYGSVYTSIAPLATFSVSRGLNNEIEVSATNAQTTEALHVRAQSIQFVSYFD